MGLPLSWGDNLEETGAVGTPVGLWLLSSLAHLFPSSPGQGVAGGWDLGICRINDICSEVSGSCAPCRQRGEIACDRFLGSALL